MTTNKNFRVKNGLEVGADGIKFADESVQTIAAPIFDQTLYTYDSVTFAQVTTPTLRSVDGGKILKTDGGTGGLNMTFYADTGDNNFQLERGAYGGAGLIFADGSRQDVAVIADQQLKKTSSVEFGTLAVKTDQVITAATGDEFGQYVKILAYGENTETNSLANVFVVEGTASTSTSQVKYGSSSFAFDGSGWIDIDSEMNPAEAFYLGKNDFAIDFWVYPTDTTAGQVIAERSSSGTTDNMQWRFASAGGTNYLLSLRDFQGRKDMEFTLTTNQWNHVCLNRGSNQYTLYVDGAVADTDTAAALGMRTIGGPVRLGNTFIVDSEEYIGFSGYIDNFRLTVGTNRWTDTTFTPPLEGDYAYTLAETTSTSILEVSTSTVTAKQLSLQGFTETVVNVASTATFAPDVSLGTIHTIELTSDIEFNGFTNPQAGQSATVVLTQDATGGHNLTSTMLFAGGSKTLTTSSSATDVLSVLYDGSRYIASLSKGHA